MSQVQKKGRLLIKPITAKLTYDTETFGKMDPYCKINLGGQQRQSTVAQDQGKNPNWQDTLDFTLNGESSFTIQVWDKDTTSKDDLIGEASVPINNDILTKKSHSGWFNLARKGGKSSGQIMLQFDFLPDQPMNKMGNMGMGQQMGMGGQMNNMGMGNMGGYGRNMGMGGNMGGMGGGYGGNMGGGNMGGGYGGNMGGGMGGNMGGGMGGGYGGNMGGMGNMGGGYGGNMGGNMGGMGSMGGNMGGGFGQGQPSMGMGGGMTIGGPGIPLVYGQGNNMGGQGGFQGQNNMQMPQQGGFNNQNTFPPGW